MFRLKDVPRERVAVVCIYGAFALAIAVFSAMWHEPWRDETQAMLIARSVSIVHWIPVLRVEMHPPLLFLLFAVTDRLLPPPWSLAVVGGLGTGALLGGTHALLHRFSRNTVLVTVTTLALGLTYTYAYELGVIVRGYGLGLGLAFASAALLDRALEEKSMRACVTGCVWAALSALTSLIAGVVVAAIVLSFAATTLVAWRKLKPLAALGIVAPAMAVDHFIASPYPRLWQHDYTPLPATTTYAELYDHTKEVMAKALTQHELWPVEVSPELTALSLRMLKLGIVIALLFALAGLRRGRARALFLPCATATSCAVLLFFVFHRWMWKLIALRHAVYLTTPPIVVAMGYLIGTERGPYPLLFFRRFALVCFVPWLALQYEIAKAFFAADKTSEFSHTRAVARALPRGARVVVDPDWKSTSIAYFRPDVIFRSPSNSGAYFTYTVWSVTHENRVDPRWLLRDECTRSTSGVFAYGNVYAFPCEGPPLLSFNTRVLSHIDEMDTPRQVDCRCLLEH